MSESGFRRNEPVLVDEAEVIPPVQPPPRAEALRDEPTIVAPQGQLSGSDQLARIEDKAARIEDKFARFESLILRMQATFEDVMNEFAGLARRSDVLTVQKRVRFLPGFGALVIAAVVAGIVGAALTLAALKFGIVTVATR